MSRLVIGAAIGVAVGIVIGAAIGIHAQVDVPDDVASAANEAGVDPVDLLGAVFTTGLGPREYLIAVGELPLPTIARGYLARVRLTHYVEYGVTYGGGMPFGGSTACSWNWALSTKFIFRDGETVVCNDRGLLGSSGWLDVWRNPELVAKYGPYAIVRVLSPDLP